MGTAVQDRRSGGQCFQLCDPGAGQQRRRGNIYTAPGYWNVDASSSSFSYRSTLFGQTCCATVAPSSTQSIGDTGESARVIQFALKLRW